MGIEETPTENDWESSDDLDYVKNVLKEAMALYKENSERGNVRLVLCKMPEGSDNAEERVVKIKIAKITDYDVISTEGHKIPFLDIHRIEMVDEE